MTTTLRLPTLFILLALVLGACSLAEKPATLEGRAFLSVGVTQNGAPKSLLKDTRVRLSFDKEGLGASAGCNSMGGAFRIEGGRLIVEAMFMTEMACGDGLDEQDRWLSEFLASKPTIQLAGDELVLSSATTTIRLLDREVAEPVPLAGPVWTVTTILTNDAAMSLPGEVVATLVFGADGQVAIDTGCNSGGGAYTVEGSTIVFEAPVMTLRLCEAAAGQMEAAVMAVIGAGRVAAAIDAGSLTLQAGANGLILSAATR